MVSGVLFIVSAVMIYDINCTTENACQHFQVKLAAGVILTIYQYAAYVILILLI
jgi:hypothetical protein